MCPGEVRDQCQPLVWLVVVEAPYPHVDEVVQGTLSRGEEGLELPHADVGSSMWEEGLVGVDIVKCARRVSTRSCEGVLW